MYILDNIAEMLTSLAQRGGVSSSQSSFRGTQTKGLQVRDHNGIVDGLLHFVHIFSIRFTRTTNAMGLPYPGDGLEYFAVDTALDGGAGYLLLLQTVGVPGSIERRLYNIFNVELLHFEDVLRRLVALRLRTLSKGLGVEGAGATTAVLLMILVDDGAAEGQKCRCGYNEEERYPPRVV